MELPQFIDPAAALQVSDLLCNRFPVRMDMERLPQHSHLCQLGCEIPCIAGTENVDGYRYGI